MAYKDPHDPRLLEKRREHYRNNKQQYFDRNDKNRAILRQYVLDLKNVTPCFDCGIIYPGEPWLTEYDHVRGEKKMGIAAIVNRGSMKALIEEIDKCELRCLICHRRRTAERGGWLDNRFSYLLD